MTKEKKADASSLEAVVKELYDVIRQTQRRIDMMDRDIDKCVGLTNDNLWKVILLNRAVSNLSERDLVKIEKRLDALEKNNG